MSPNEHRKQVGKLGAILPVGEAGGAHELPRDNERVRDISSVPESGPIVDLVAGAVGAPEPEAIDCEILDRISGQSPVVRVKIGATEVEVVLDTGAETSLIPLSFYKKYLEHELKLGSLGNFIKVYGANDLEIPLEGYLQAPVTVYGKTVEGVFLVRRDDQGEPRRGTRPTVLLGCNILRELLPMNIPGNSPDKADWELVSRAMTSASVTPPPESTHEPVVPEQVDFSIVTTGRHVVPPLEVMLISCKLSDSIDVGTPLLVQEQRLADHSYVMEGVQHASKEGEIKIAVANLGDKPKRILKGFKITMATKASVNTSVVLEPTEEGISVETREVAEMAGNSNFNQVNASTCSSVVEDVDEGLNSEEETERETFTFQDGTQYTLPPGISTKELKLTINQKEALVRVLQKRDKAFSKGEFDLGCCDLIPHEIRLKDSTPVNLPYRRIAPHLVTQVRQQLQDMLDQGIIQKSTSPYASPVVLVKKAGNKLRWTLDYRVVNSKVIRDAFPLPRLTESLEALQGSKWFSSLDLSHGYFQQVMHPDSVKITAFRVPWGLYEFLRTPQGLCNSPGTFQRVMEAIFGDMNLIELIIYLDDLLIFAPSFEQMLTRLDKVLERLIKNNLKVKGKKCQLARQELVHLGHVVNEQGIATDPSKVDKIRAWPTPVSHEHLASFVGLASYYRRFIPAFSTIAAPLHAIIAKGRAETAKGRSGLKAGKPPSSKFVWSKEADQSFNELKRLLSEAPVLAYPQFDKEFILETDASLLGLGACLCQADGEGNVHPIAYASRGLRGAERNYPDISSFKLELLALKWAVTDKFKDYLMGSKCIVYTDHNPLAHLKTAKLGATEHRWVAQLAPFDLEIRYRTGKSNRCADALSRYPRHESVKIDLIELVLPGTAIDPDHVIKVRCCKVQEAAAEASDKNLGSSPVLPAFSFDELTKFQREDESLGVVLERFETGWEPGRVEPEPVNPLVQSWMREWDKLEIRNGVLYRRVQDPVLGIIYQFLAPEKLQATLLELAHDKMGHQGVGRTVALLRTRCFWPGLQNDVRAHIKKCFPCIVAKAPTPKVRTPMRHLLAFSPQELLAIDFLKLDKGKGGFEDVLVMTDAFSKFALAVPCRDQTAPRVAVALRNHWFAHYGIPHRLHSDQGRNFESELVAEICRLYGIKKSRTTPFHPQGNSITERFNRSLCNLIKSVDVDDRRRWPELLPHLVHIYNCTPHSVTGIAPYTMLFGKEPTIEIDHLLANAKSDWNADFVQNQADLFTKAHEIAKQRIAKSHDANKRRYDTKAQDAPLSVGDRVLLKKCNFRERHKLDNNFLERPYVVTAVNREKDVYAIRPVSGGPEKWVNRKLLILDPRVEPIVPEFPVPMVEHSSDSEEESNDSDDDSVEYQYFDFDPPVALAEPRRSRRVNKGRHSNPAHWPRSVLDR